jgi:pimeloyl-ACP methyl ester carboxylesterase
VSTLKQLNSSQTLLIYGEKDTATPPTLVQEKMRYSNFTESNFFIVPNGGHDIANSDTTLIVNKISSFLKK